MTQMRNIISNANFGKLAATKSRFIGNEFRSLISAINHAPIPKLQLNYTKDHKLDSVVVEGIKYYPSLEGGTVVLWDCTSKEFSEPLTASEFVEKYSWDVHSH